MNQPDCSEYLEVPAAPPVLPSHAILPGTWMWIAVFAAVLIFEVWAIRSGSHTMSEAVWQWPTWGKWLLGTGFAVLLFHLFLQR